jgi:hypothetical protein
MKNGPSYEVLDLTGSDDDGGGPMKKQKTDLKKQKTIMDLKQPAAKKSNGNATKSLYLIALTWPSASESKVLKNYLLTLQQGVRDVSQTALEHCFQRDDSRHMSIDQVSLTLAKADALSYEGIATPPTLTFDSLQVNGNYAGLKLDEVSRAAVMDMVGAMGAQHRLTKNGVKDKTAHVSLLRKRRFTGQTKAPFLAGKKAVEGMVVGAVEGGLRVIIKKLGETPWSDARELFSGA